MKIRVLATILLTITGVAGFAQGAVPDVKDPAAQHDWPRFRGPNGDGVSTATGIPTTWSKDQNVLWKTDLPKTLIHENVTRKQLEDLPNAYDPWSSPIIVGDKVFLASAGIKVDEHKLFCFNLADGKQLWEKQIPPGPIVSLQMSNLLDNVDWVKTKDGPPRKSTHTAIGYSIATPCSDGERVFVTFSTYVLTALDFQGNILWQRSLAKTTDKPPSSGHYAKETGVNLGICLGASPIVYKDTVIQVCESSIRAFDCKTGDLKYEIPLTFGEQWATPILVTLKDKTVMINHSSRTLAGYDPENGKKIFWAGNIWNYGASPVYDDGYVFGIFGGAVCTMFALPVDANSANDILANRFKKTADFSTKMPAFTEGSPVVFDHIVYQYVNNYNQGGLPAKIQPDKGMLVGLKRTAGSPEIVSQTPLPGVSNWASLVATADGYIYVATGGKSYVIKAGPKPEIVGVNDLNDYNIGPSPAVTDGKLIIRGSTKLWCIGKP